MIGHSFSLGAALAATALSLPSASIAAPVHARDSGNCTSLGQGPLGFNSSSIGVYNYFEPGYHLTFNNSGVNGDDKDYLLANPAYGFDNPEFFELISCLFTPSTLYAKGSIDVYQGYIKTSDGNCIQRTTDSTGDSNSGQFSKRPCAYTLDDLSGDSAAQHFQFSIDSFYSYYSVVFLGSEQGPSANANTSFQSGGNYKTSLQDLPSSSAQLVEVDYQAGAEQKGSPSTALIAHLGSQYQPRRQPFPECTLVKNGTLSFINDTGSHPVSLSTISYSYYNHGIIPVLNGTESSQGFEFYECKSDYMGYTEQDTSSKYGHLMTAQDSESMHCFMRTNEHDIYSNLNSAACGTEDNSAQLLSFFSYDEEGGEIQFLGARKSDQDATKYYWALDGDQIVLSNTTTTNTLRFS